MCISDNNDKDDTNRKQSYDFKNSLTFRYI